MDELFCWMELAKCVNRIVLFIFAVKDSLGCFNDRLLNSR